MSSNPKFRLLTPSVKPAEDPAGLDQLLLAVFRTGCSIIETQLSNKTGTQVKLWGGKDGLGAVIEEHIKRAGIPNKRLPELVTPRSVIEALTRPPKKQRRKLKAKGA